jgi:mannose-1-phosphate guanylyltransferase
MNTIRGKSSSMSKVYPVLLAGGSGTRLWPLSHKSYPKQFSNLIGEKTLFQYLGRPLSGQAHMREARSCAELTEPQATIRALDCCRRNSKIRIDNEVKLVSEGQSVCVQLGAKHRMENLGKSAMVVIEFQIGTYLGEDDITRYEDIYLRS